MPGANAPTGRTNGPLLQKPLPQGVQLAVGQMRSELDLQPSLPSSRKTKLTFPFWYSIGETFLRASPALYQTSAVPSMDSGHSRLRFNRLHVITRPCLIPLKIPVPSLSGR